MREELIDMNMRGMPQFLTDRQTDSRNYGIDLLRLVAMLMVVILHVLGHGGVLSATTGIKHHVAWLVETTAYCAVDCYGIISGFVSYSEKKKTYRYGKIFGFWLQVITYNFGITLLVFMLKPGSIEINQLILSAFPITIRTYWYVSAYAGLFFLIPWLNKFLRSCNNREATHFMMVLLLVFCGYVTWARRYSDCFYLNKGYSCAWLTILYLVGAWLKKCDIPNRIRSRCLLLGSAICIIFSWELHEFVHVPGSEIFVDYTSFTIVFVAVSLVCVASKLHIPSKAAKVIACFSPAAFGVYLIHEQPLFKKHFMNDGFLWIANRSVWQLPVLVLGCALGIFMICLLIEKTRLVFFKLLKIDQFSSFVGKKVERLMGRYI